MAYAAAEDFTRISIFRPACATMVMSASVLKSWSFPQKRLLIRGCVVPS